MPDKPSAKRRRSSAAPVLTASAEAESVPAESRSGMMPDTIPQVVAASRDVYAAIDEVDTLIAARLGVHRGDLRCLNLLEHGPRRPSEIGSALRMTSGAVTALIDRLESAGYARRVHGVRDRRAVHVELPPAAFAQVGRLYGAIARSLTEAFRHLNEVEIDATTRGLTLFAAGCRAGVAHIAQDAT
ncbi:MarR family winged helix-turn-helix transcriptional regulator [Gemmatimonas groenlandica]|uniref:MarR family transcriptional regulator n=1 Tax=Gemmatimonas groenlandica TaxID=2732249 RepID=A0A6M4IW44_9BACT|nr:MarR family transcriptional regulator [Gemmatimonas groenlandica]QJR37929.1 MarR family transcriptional regulator [Gemmatimonas groenlandica]